MGREICLALGRYGAIVIVADINFEGAEQTAQRISKNGGNAYIINFDVTNNSDVKKNINNILTKHGRLDYIFNVAGICIAGDTCDLDYSQWKQVIDVNFFGVLNGTLAAYSIMVKQGFGHIINMSSMSGFAPFAMNTPYTTSKYAVKGLSDSLRYEGKGLGVKVSTICPGVVKTEMFDSYHIVNVDRTKFEAQMPEKMFPATNAAKIILRGVSRNKGLIIFPLHAKLLWMVSKFFPFIIGIMNREMIRRFRAIQLKK